MRYKLFLFLFIIFLVPNVLAYDYDVTNNITAPTGPATGGHYLGLEIYNSGSQNNYTVNTRYNGTLSEIIFNLPLPSTAGQCFTTNMVYTITMEMATNDWRNRFSTPYISWSSNSTDWHSGNVTFVSMKKIYFKFKIPSTDTTCHDFVYVRLRSSSVSTTAFTGETNWNLSKIVLSDGYTNSGGSGGSGNSSTPTNQDIINNQTNNTSNIIENSNNNTQDIIDNSNANFLRQYNQTRNQKTNSCSNFIQFDYSMGYRFKWNGVIAEASNDYYTSDFVPFNSTDLKYSITGSNDSNVDEYICFYDSSKNLIGSECFYLRNRNATAPSGSKYFRLSTKKYTTDVFYGYDGCSNRIDELNQNITNPNIENGTGSDFFNNFSSNDHGLSSIITIPLTTIQSLTTQSCIPLQIPIPFTNSSVSLPCMTEVYEQNIPTIYNLWKIVSFGIIAYFIAIDIFHLVKGFKDPDSDKVEVLDL